MPTDCNVETLHFTGLGRRKVVAKFDGGRMSSDAGALLLREVNERCDLMGRFAECFTDYRDPDKVEHPLERLLAQRIFGLCLGYEDLNDHDRLRDDSALALAVGCTDIAGEARVRERDKGHPLAGANTLNRLELGVEETAASDRYKRVVADFDKIDALLVELFMESYQEPPERIILDLDATDDTIHGQQENRFFHGYYGKYCFLPLYIICGNHVLLSRLRPSNIDASKGATQELARVVAQIRTRWPEVQVWIRADSGFCREKIMAWCEANEVSYILGLARNKRLQAMIESEMEQSRKTCKASGEASRRFCCFSYQTVKSWSRARRTVAKAEYLPGLRGYTARFVVTNLGQQYSDRHLYEDLYCARGDMENRIKEQQLSLFADRTSTSKMQSNQLRVYFSAIAHALMTRVKKWGLRGTELASAQCSTIRTRLFKTAVVVYASVRRFKLSLSSAYPWQELFARVLANLCVGAPVVHAPARPPPVHRS